MHDLEFAASKFSYRLWQLSIMSSDRAYEHMLLDNYCSYRVLFEAAGKGKRTLGRIAALTGVGYIGQDLEAREQKRRRDSETLDKALIAAGESSVCAWLSAKGVEAAVA